MGSQLYEHLMGCLEDAVGLTQDKRLIIAEEISAEARMTDDSVHGAEDFLSKWRVARRLLYKEGLVRTVNE